MNKVFVIERAADVLNTVKYYLKEEDIKYAAFQSISEALVSPDIPAIIILFSSDSLAEIRQDLSQIKNNLSFVRVPKIVILPLNTTIDRAACRELDVQEFFGIPVEKLKFQATISRFLRQAPRRIFRILVTLLRSGSNLRYSGVSMDFSESGMAFACTSDFSVGEILQISFVNPKNRSRFSLKSEVVRKTSTPTGSSIFYGVTFRQMSGKDIRDLRQFIAGGS